MINKIKRKKGIAMSPKFACAYRENNQLAFVPNKYSLVQMNLWNWMTDFTRWEVQSRLLTYFLYIMKILIVSQYYFPEQFQINDIAPELVKRGHEITILCGLPNYPKGVYFEGFDNKESVEIKEKEYFKQTRSEEHTSELQSP